VVFGCDRASAKASRHRFHIFHIGRAKQSGDENRPTCVYKVTKRPARNHKGGLWPPY
jgi:hypothetical protein